MHKYPARREIDLSKFTGSEGPFETRYGLPETVSYCNKCVVSNQRPVGAVEFKHTKQSIKKTVQFDGENVCNACRYAEKKWSTFDWDAKEEELKDICARHRRTDGAFDCIVSGSGGKDSFFAAHILKYKYGMHPLTVTWAPHIYTDWGWKNFQRWIHAGFENILVHPNGLTHRLLTRLALENLLHPFQPFILGQKGISPKIAHKYKIPLIFYGEYEVDLSKKTHSKIQDASFYTNKNADDIVLAGLSIGELKENFGLTNNDVRPYLPIMEDEKNDFQCEVHYLGYYLRWHPQHNYYYAVEHGNFEAAPERTPGTYTKYNSIDDKLDDLHYYTTFMKFGIGRATYEAFAEIRCGDLTREEGVALVKKYDGEFPERFIDELFAYLSVPASQYPEAHARFEQPVMDRAYFDNLCDSFRSPHLWKWTGTGWELRHPIWKEGTGESVHAEGWRGNQYASYRKDVP
ncbi:N-acetyl sugar amidotransferase [Pseudodesulfovibrio karagichevae]|uniref:N-acetyl sugar amidotransferase n=1 Tax=Pseudodesulfovibrio karagichevae TaxID=3239305 RepID=A0ABV4K0L8_9BACT